MSVGQASCRPRVGAAGFVSVGTGDSSAGASATPATIGRWRSRLRATLHPLWPGKEPERVARPDVDLHVGHEPNPSRDRSNRQVACRSGTRGDGADRRSRRSAPTRSLPKPTPSGNPYTPLLPPPVNQRHRYRREYRRGRHRRAWWGDEAGAVAAELVIATPLLLLLVLGVVQFALWEHASGIAEAAAQQGLSVARLQGETAQGGTAETRSVLAQLGTGVLVGPQVTATRTGATTTVVVSGHAESVVGIFSLPVRATAVGPTEPPAPNGAGP
ncbi:MAG: pilus assembly protein [Actinomycetota bacterium]|nr:pilus assembly protein [Actinomycetota bacterium]